MSEILQFPNGRTNTATNPKDETEKGVVKIEYTNGEMELVEADMFASSTDIPGFLIFWNEVPEQQMVALINSLSIKKIDIIINSNLGDIKDDNCEGC